MKILKNKDYDYMKELERFYYSLPLPTGMNKNIQYIDGSYRIDDGNDGESTIEETVEYLNECWNIN